MKELLYIFIGGGVGSVLRFLISNFTNKLLIINNFPIGTFAVNILGCFLIGLFSNLYKENPELKFILITGFCGGFTTFSTFSSESLNLFQNQQYLALFIYLVLSIILGISAVYLGMKIKF